MRAGSIRWTLSVAVVACAHAAIIWSFAHRSSSLDDDAGAPVMTLDLAPIPAAPIASAQPSPDEVKENSAAQNETPPAPEPTLPPVTPDPTPSPPLPTSLAETPVPTPQPSPTAEARLPPQDPAKEGAEASSAPVVAAADRAPVARAAQGREEATTAAMIQTWQRTLIAQIERHKRFPLGAAGRSGVVDVVFAIDRTGRLLNVRIARSSGAARLDEAALDLIRRSQPFPQPPAAIPERDLMFVAPVRYLRGH